MSQEMHGNMHTIFQLTQIQDKNGLRHNHSRNRSHSRDRSHNQIQKQNRIITTTMFLRILLRKPWIMIHFSMAVQIRKALPKDIASWWKPFIRTIQMVIRKWPSASKKHMKHCKRTIKNFSYASVIDKLNIWQLWGIWYIMPIGKRYD